MFPTTLTCTFGCAFWYTATTLLNTESSRVPHPTHTVRSFDEAARAPAGCPTEDLTAKPAAAIRSPASTAITRRLMPSLLGRRYKLRFRTRLYDPLVRGSSRVGAI